MAIPLHARTQLDAFIRSATLNGQTVGSDVIPHLNPIFDQAGDNMFAAPVVDAGYNTTGFVPTTLNAPVPAGTLGALVWVARTTGPLGGVPGDYCPADTFAGAITSSCDGIPRSPGGQEVDLTGTTAAGAPVSFRTTSAPTTGAYSFSVPYADLPLTHLSVSVPLAATLPNLFSGLAGQTNAQVASFAASEAGCWRGKPTATIFATALSADATDSTLAGGTYASCFGFNVSAGGDCKLGTLLDEGFTAILDHGDINEACWL